MKWKKILKIMFIIIVTILLVISAVYILKDISINDQMHLLD